MIDSYIFFDITKKELLKLREDEINKSLTPEENLVRNNQYFRERLAIIKKFPEEARILDELLNIKNEEAKKAILELIIEPYSRENLLCKDTSLHKFLKIVK